MDLLIAKPIRFAFEVSHVCHFALQFELYSA